MTLNPLILHQGRSLTLKRTTPDDAAFLFEKMYSCYEFMRLFRLNDTAETVEQVREKINYKIPFNTCRKWLFRMLNDS
jgi:hypothetical protein